MTRTFSGRPASPRPQSIFMRARALLSNRGVYVKANPNRKVILTAIGRCDGVTTPQFIDNERVDEIIQAWVEKQDGSGRQADPATTPAPAFKPLGFSKEMREAMLRCDPARIGSQIVENEKET